MKKKLLILAMSMATLVSAVAFALPHGYAFEITYYKDAAKSIVVGERIYHCGGAFYAIGEITEYSHELNLGPCRIHPPVLD